MTRLTLNQRVEALRAQYAAAGTRQQVKAPCSCDPETKGPGMLETILGRSKFQMTEIAAIAARPDFLHFTGNPSYNGINDYGQPKVYVGPVVISWYDNEGSMWYCRMGRNKYLIAPQKVRR